MSYDTVIRCSASLPLPDVRDDTPNGEDQALHFPLCEDEAGFQGFVDSTIKRIESGTRTTARGSPR